MRKKISIIGRGTAGCISYLSLRNNCKDAEIDWYFDRSRPTSSVGEGTTISFPFLLENFDGFSLAENIHKLDARPKLGIDYEGWGKSDFVHPFGGVSHGLHFDALKFQDEVFKAAEIDNFVTVTDKSVQHDDVDADYIIDCSGRPEITDEFIQPKYIPVNSVHVAQCAWVNGPKWDNTKTIARRYGWVFVIPLRTRCSVGYLYNKDITPLKDVIDDLNEVIVGLDVIPTEKTNSFSFSNYIRKEIIQERVSYAGNSGFFLEPMEATTLDAVMRVASWADSAMRDSNPQAVCLMGNKAMHNFFTEVEHFIMMHYAAGSKWKNDFWDFAQARGQAAMQAVLKNDRLKKFYTNPSQIKIFDAVGHFFEPKSYEINLSSLGLNPVTPKQEVEAA